MNQTAPTAEPFDDFEYDAGDEFGDCELDPADDCMLMDDGQCMAAGSEWCDFECPYRDSELFVGSAAWKRKHSKTGKKAAVRDLFDGSASNG